ncbi:hypothetical protein TRFO_28310 [Tritrichomonas foetus]|uniref:Uncharacterized protein n=1 Tax=Tritrichomonas foetus TaxID=1144522 RepID=A0A1J4JZZ2_9EUKA|nr:hypothetical protein TRFO_28310 [Tritrichomonas foetus]|eukprot:OHT04258.1 hypothetical protein TRFO_28310 [Tritrichomonas foetus]
MLLNELSNCFSEILLWNLFCIGHFGLFKCILQVKCFILALQYKNYYDHFVFLFFCLVFIFLCLVFIFLCLVFIFLCLVFIFLCLVLIFLCLVLIFLCLVFIFLHLSFSFLHRFIYNFLTLNYYLGLVAEVSILTTFELFMYSCNSLFD